MADLNIPNLNSKSEKYIFKKKLTLRKKSKKRLVFESIFMFILGLFLVYINYSIPNKNLLFQNLPTTINNSITLMIDLITNLSNILLIIFIAISYFLTFFLFIGAFYRIFKISKRKARLTTYK